MNKIYIGWDSREDIAYQVCEHSIRRRAGNPVKIISLKQSALRQHGHYFREPDKLASTEFTFTRFLVPYLAGYKGWALFIDCDMICLEDINTLFDQADDQYAVMVAKHNYNPPEGTKMDGQLQLPYPRKNWSSVMLINCAHPKVVKNLTRQNVNIQSGKHLHRFQWCEDNDIGEISHEWNWLVGHYTEPADGKPKMLHLTEGGPWFEHMRNCEYSDIWKKELIDMYTT